jgi:hypothetical protein
MSFAQYTREEKLQQLKDRADIKVTGIEKDILKIEYPGGKVLYKNIGDYQYQESSLPSEALAKEGIQNPVYSPTYDSTIIDLRFIDTTLYYHKYSYWTEVPIHNWDFDCLRIGDINNNGKTELYGSRKYFWNNFEPIIIYELNDAGNFIPKHRYDSVFIARNIYDADKDGEEEILLTLPPIYGLGNQQRFFSKPTPTSFAEQLNFIFIYGTGAQLNDITLGDFDGDQFTDMLFARFSTPSVYIFEYNPLVNNFDSVYRFDVNEPPPYGNSGFSVGDFDLDGKNDIVFGTGRGNVFVIENEGNNQYTNSWQGSVESYHAYIHTWSSDIDKNGKPEFWVLADAYYNGIGTTRITIFETNGNNSYHAVGRVDLVGIFSFYAGTMQAVDIDGDGTEEIAVCIDDNFLILKFIGSRDHQIYELYYIKQNDLLTQQEWTTYYGAIMYDLNQNGVFNILLSMNHILYQQTSRFVTKIYKPDSLTNAKDLDPNVLQKHRLAQSYPNPFNSATNISFKLIKTDVVSINVYNILGKEIKLLLDENLPAAEYTIQWDGKDNKGNLLSGGVYFIQMKAGEYQHTIKTVLLK